MNLTGTAKVRNTIMVTTMVMESLTWGLCCGDLFWTVMNKVRLERTLCVCV